MPTDHHQLLWLDHPETLCNRKSSSFLQQQQHEMTKKKTSEWYGDEPVAPPPSPYALAFNEYEVPKCASSSASVTVSHCGDAIASAAAAAQRRVENNGPEESVKSSFIARGEIIRITATKAANKILRCNWWQFLFGKQQFEKLFLFTVFCGKSRNNCSVHSYRL